MNAPGLSAVHGNPFPGLRPFREDEEHLFFGRESQIDALVDTLARTHFLAVVGSSGSGKSSLVNCGLRPALHRGLMARAGTVWRIAQFRPGHDPLRSLARALAYQEMLFEGSEPPSSFTRFDIIHATLQLSKLGLIEIYEQAKLEDDVNLLIIADQFEELFRYRAVDSSKSDCPDGATTDAIAFVKLLLEVREQTQYPIYVVLTIRSDFLGDCVQFPGLPEAINAGQYLVPRMTRDERRAAINGPVRVAGANISPVLLTRLVNDVGDNPDQLSILQHALNRTWARWGEEGGEGPLELVHYEAIGTMAHALDQHAEAAYAELGTARLQQICEKLFKALTDKATDPRGVRRPTPQRALSALAGATEEEITHVINVFREPSRSFLMPPAGEALSPDTVIDISHESLMRIWERLNTWVEEEAQSARLYRRLAETAMLHAEGKASLWRDPDLQLALRWREEEQPTAEWGERYHEGFDSAMRFLEASTTRRDEEAREQEAQRQRELEHAQVLAEEQRRRATEQAKSTAMFRTGLIIMFILLLAAVGLIVVAWSAKNEARIAEQKAIEEKNNIENLTRKAKLRGLQTLVAEALTSLDEELDLGLLLAKEASGRLINMASDRLNKSEYETVLNESFEALRALVNGVGAAPRLRTFLIGPGDDNLAFRVESLAFNTDGTILASGNNDGSIILWDVANRAPLQEPLAGYTDGPISSLIFSPDGRTLASSSNDEILLWDVKTGRRKGGPLIYEHQITGAKALTFNSEGDTLISVNSQGDIIYWNVATGKPLRELTSSPMGSAKIALSPEGKYAAALAVNSQTIQLFDLQTGRFLGQLSGPEIAVQTLAFSPDGSIIAGGLKPNPLQDKGAHNSIWLWDPRTLQSRDKLPLSDQEGVRKLALSESGNSVAFVTGNGNFQVWQKEPLSAHDLRLSFEPLQGALSALKKHRNVLSVALSSDGKSLASGFEHGAITVWAPKDTRQLFPPPLERGSRTEFHLQGNTLVSAKCSQKGATCRKLQLDLKYWQNRACRIANRNFTHAEWQRYFPDEPYRKTYENLVIDARLLFEAIEQAQKGDVDEAVSSFSQLSQSNPSFRPIKESEFKSLALYQRAKILATKSDTAQAADFFQRAKDLDPTIVGDPVTEAHLFAFTALVKVALQDARLGKAIEATEAFNRAQEMNPII